MNLCRFLSFEKINYQGNYFYKKQNLVHEIPAGGKSMY